MPKKITSAKMQEWLRAYDEGRSEAAIAKDAHSDVRTVKRGIEQARREREAQMARMELLKNALREHQDSLLRIIDRLLRALVVPPPDLEVEHRKLPRRPIALAGAMARYDSVQGWRLVLDVQDELEWELLQEHLRRDAMWKAVAQWQNAVERYLKGILALKWKTAALLQEKTGYRVAEKIDSPPQDGRIWPALVELLYQGSLNRIRGVLGGISLEKRAVATAAGYIEDGRAGGRLAYAPGLEQECKKRILDAFKELQVSPEAEKVRAADQEVKNLTAKARRAVEEIRLLRLVPGQCRVCRRLGM